MTVADIERVRQVRLLVAAVRRETSAEALVTLAGELRRAGRPDESLLALERCATAASTGWPWAFEQLLTLAALGRVEDAAAFAAALPERFALPVSLRLIAALAGTPGGFTAPSVRNILIEHCDADDPKATLARLPLSAIVKVPWRAWRVAVSGLALLPRLRLAARIQAARVRFGFANLIAEVLLTAASVIARRRVVIGSMGRFTRLADVVDRLDPVLRRLRDGPESGRSLLVVLYYGGYPNEELFHMYAERCLFIRLRGRIFTGIFNRVYGYLEKADRHFELTVDYRAIKDDFSRRPPVLAFGNARMRTLEVGLRDVGIDPDRPIVCFGLRDMAYYQFYGQVMGIDLSTHRRSETWHRCPPLANYAEVADQWARRGYQVVRMGLRVSEHLPAGRHPQVIDYATGMRSDALDTFLFSRCHFLLAGDTGLFSGAAAFDRPTVLSDLFLVRNTMYSSNKTSPSIFVPKLVFDRLEQRLLSFAEWIYFNHLFSFAQDCEDARFELVHNTVEDILEATAELDDRLAGRYRPEACDRDLQEQFRRIYAPYHVGYGSTALISAGFLRRHADLLG